jgi:hypothetical protein
MLEIEIIQMLEIQTVQCEIVYIAKSHIVSLRFKQYRMNKQVTEILTSGGRSYDTFVTVEQILHALGGNNDNTTNEG